MNIQELKLKSSEQLITQAEELGIENASTLRKQEILLLFSKSCRKRGNYWCGCIAIITRWFWIFKSNGVKLPSRTRRYLCKPESN